MEKFNTVIKKPEKKQSANQNMHKVALKWSERGTVCWGVEWDPFREEWNISVLCSAWCQKY